MNKGRSAEMKRRIEKLRRAEAAAPTWRTAAELSVVQLSWGLGKKGQF